MVKTEEIIVNNTQNKIILIILKLSPVNSNVEEMIGEPIDYADYVKVGKINLFEC